MKVLRYILCFVVFYVSQYAVAQEFKQFFYPNGVVSSEGFIVEGKPDGLWKTFYENGGVKSIGKRTDFMLDSIWMFYDAEGHVEKEISYFENKKNGYSKFYSYADSVSYLSSMVLFVNDQKQGEECFFSPDGKKTKMIPYKDNLREGTGYEYDDTTIVTISVYENNVNISNLAINRTDSLGRKIGVHMSFYPNGTIRSEAYYAHGKLDGQMRLFDKHGQLQKTLVYEGDTLLHSSSNVDDFIEPTEKKTYYSDSKVRTKGAYRGKTPIGIHREYDRQGVIIGGKLYDTTGTLLATGITLESGEKEGKWIYYGQTGKKVSEGEYSQGKQIGMWKYYYPDETLKQVGYYSQGLYSGVWEFYSATGDIQKREEYSQGKREGLSTEYDDEEEKILEGMYKNDLRHGYWVDKTGDLITQGEYVYGERTGVWKSTYKNGNKAFKGEYFSDKPQGKHVYYYKNGQVEHEEYWKQGVPVKTWNYYEENGALKYSVYYKGGKEYRITSPLK